MEFGPRAMGIFDKLGDIVMIRFSTLMRAAWVGCVFYLGSAMVTANAATISLMPSSQTVIEGDLVSLDLHMDFSTDPTVGGGIDIFYDASLLQYVSFTLDPTFPTDPNFTDTQPDLLPNELNGIAFGNFGGLSGPARVGTLMFNTIGAGGAVLTMADNDMPWGPFFSSTTFTQQGVTYVGASVTVNPIPLPAAGWLMLGGLVGLIGIARRQKHH